MPHEDDGGEAAAAMARRVSRAASSIVHPSDEASDSRGREGEGASTGDCGVKGEGETAANVTRRACRGDQKSGPEEAEADRELLLTASPLYSTMGGASFCVAAFRSASKALRSCVTVARRWAMWSRASTESYAT